jgi:hypothetical protein
MKIADMTTREITERIDVLLEYDLDEAQTAELRALYAERIVRNVLDSAVGVTADVPPDDSCIGCGAEGKYYDDLCYQCQCEYHAVGRYDMDGDGWQ